MPSTYMRQEEILKGGPFKCYNCGKTLVKKVTGSHYELELMCPRCKAEIKMIVKEPIPV